MTQQLRRIGHMIERSPDNLASATRTTDGGSRAFLAGSVTNAGADPGASGSADGSMGGWGGQGPAALGTAGSSADGVGVGGLTPIPDQFPAYPIEE